MNNMKLLKNTPIRTTHLKKLLLLTVMICTSAGMWGQTLPWKRIVPWETLKEEATNGNKDFQYFVGKTYLEGSDVFFANTPGKLDTKVQVDKEQAVYWLRKAADQGVAAAELELGTCYSLGEGVSVDIKQALYWYHRAADQGHSLAQANLGVYYQEGYGVEQNGNHALYWYEKAVKNKDKTLGGNVSAIKDLIKALKDAGFSAAIPPQVDKEEADNEISLPE